MNIDGIGKKNKVAFKLIQPREMRVVVKAKWNPPVQPKVQSRVVAGVSVFPAVVRRRYYSGMTVFVLAAALAGAFLTGMWFSWKTDKSIAENETSRVVAEQNIPIPAPVPLATSTAEVSNDQLFNTPLEYLKNYFESRQTEQALLLRKQKLKQYLTARNSPFAEQSDVIAEQPHWKLILAISFAESTLGRKCYYNNCSGIGGADIKTYSSVGEWVTDFNKLIEKRYKDKTLEQMCGVYVKPCNPNWLLATRQILNELSAQGIE